MTTTPTPGQTLQEVRRYGCGCTSFVTHIKWCPLHAAAPEMRDALTIMVEIVGKAAIPDLHADKRQAFYDARALLAKIQWTP